MTDPMAEWTRLRDQTSQTTQTTETTDLTQPPRSRASAPLAVLVLVAGVVGVLVISGVGVYFLSVWVGDRMSAFGIGDSGQDAEAPSPSYSGPLNTAEGFEGLRKAFEKELDSTEVVNLTVYPRYAVATVLEGSGPGRTRSLFYDGDFTENSLGTTTDRPFDIARIDPEKLARLSRQARAMVDDADSWYVIIRAPDSEGAVIWAYASNAYGEGGYISARVDGKVVRKVTW